MAIIPCDKWAAQLGKYAAKKRTGEKVADRLLRIGLEGRAARMKQCASSMVVRVYDDGARQVVRTNLCHDRLCPTCAWRMSVQRLGHMLKTIDYLIAQGELGGTSGYTLGMLTLTVRNMPAGELSTALDDMNKAWNRMQKRAKFQKILKGWARSVEVTVSRDRKTVHPHIHVLVVAKPSDLVSIKEMGAMWQEALRVDYRPSIDLTEAYYLDERGCKVYLSKAKRRDVEAEAAKKALLECSKYVVKPGKLLDLSGSDLLLLAQALKGRQLATYGGCIKQARLALAIITDEPRDDATTVPATMRGQAYHEIILRWSGARIGYQEADDNLGLFAVAAG